MNRSKTEHRESGRRRIKKAALFALLAVVTFVSLVVLIKPQEAQAQIIYPARYCYPPPPDLMAWWPLDGNTMELIHGNDLVGINNPGYTAGKVDMAASVSNSAYFEAAHSPVLNMGRGDFTFEAWVKIPAGYYPTIEVFQKRILGPVNMGYLVFVYTGKLGLQMGDSINSHYNYVDTRLINDGAWHHIAITVERDNPNGLTFYVDAIASATQNPMNRQGSLDNLMAFRIGKQGPIEVDEISLYDRVLESGEIRGIHNARSLGKCK